MLIMKGQKRKLPSEDEAVADRSSPFWENHRQFVFSVSLNKYQHSQELPEPCLRRSVLIANTLRQISQESYEARSTMSQSHCTSSSAHQHGSFTNGARYHSSLMSASNHLALPSCSMGSSNYLPNHATSCDSNPSHTPLSEKHENEDWGSMSMDMDFSLSAAVSSILTVLDSSIDGSQQETQRTCLRSLENLPGPCEEGGTWAKQEAFGYGGSMEQQAECRSQESSMEDMRSCYLSDTTGEGPFQDIDTSLLEKDMGMLGFTASRGGYPVGDDLLRYLPPLSSSFSSPLHPVSLPLNQNLTCLPSFSSFSPLSSTVSSSSHLPSQPFSGQNYIREGLELEHLMEVVVES